MREIRDRNTEQHQEGHSVNTESTSLIFHMPIYYKRGGGMQQTSLTLGNDLNSLTFGSAGVNPPL